MVFIWQLRVEGGGGGGGGVITKIKLNGVFNGGVKKAKKKEYFVFCVICSMELVFCTKKDIFQTWKGDC